MDQNFIKYTEKYSNLLSLLSTINITGAWFYYPIFAQNNNKYANIYLIILLILSLTQFIIYITYFVYLERNDSKTGNIVLGESSAWLLFAPILIFAILSLFRK